MIFLEICTLHELNNTIKQKVIYDIRKLCKHHYLVAKNGGRRSKESTQPLLNSKRKKKIVASHQRDYIASFVLSLPISLSASSSFPLSPLVEHYRQTAAKHHYGKAHGDDRRHEKDGMALLKINSLIYTK